MMKVELIADYACVCGEGPLWHAAESRLYWTDIETGRMFWYDPATGKHEQCYEGPRVGGFTVQADGSLLLFRDRGNICTFRDGKVLDTVVDKIKAEAAGRFNDVIADPRGRVFCGTLDNQGGMGRLYLLETDGKLKKLLSNVACSNGMAFSADRQTMYYTESIRRTIWALDYDEGTGTLGERRAWVQVSEKGATPGPGIPDGMTIDGQGNIWSARWGGWGVVGYRSNGQEFRRIDVPTPACSSVTFGGPDLAEMYLTTAGGDKKDENGAAAGALFRARPGVKGVAEFVSRVGL